MTMWDGIGLPGGGMGPHGAFLNAKPLNTDFLGKSNTDY